MAEDIEKLAEYKHTLGLNSERMRVAALDRMIMPDFEEDEETEMKHSNLRRAEMKQVHNPAFGTYSS